MIIFGTLLIWSHKETYIFEAFYGKKLVRNNPREEIGKICSQSESCVPPIVDLLIGT